MITIFCHFCEKKHFSQKQMLRCFFAKTTCSSSLSKNAIFRAFSPFFGEKNHNIGPCRKKSLRLYSLCSPNLSSAQKCFLCEIQQSLQNIFRQQKVYYFTATTPAMYFAHRLGRF
jgi:hypothetical protein